MRTSLALAAAALLMLQGSVHAQEPRGPALYKVEFTIRDGAGAAAKVRRYSLLTAPGEKAVFKVGNRVPTATGSFQPGAGGVGINPLVNTQYTYLDVGVNLECTVVEAGPNRLAMRGLIDISSIVQHQAAQGATPPNPTVAQTRLQLDTSIEPGKPTVVASMDDPETTRQFQVEATVTRVN
jgi:hypothetical protein